MDIKYFGGNCIKFSSRQTSVVVDDVVHLGAKSVVSEKDIQIITDKRSGDRSTRAHFVVEGPGEYEVSEISITGIPARAHIDEENTSNATIYRVIFGEVRIGVIGHIYPELSEDQLEALGTIDILCVPVGGNGYTLDGIGAQKIIRKIEPKIIIPTHYDDKSLKYEVPQQDLETALKALAMEPVDTLEVLKIKNSEFGDGTRLIVLEHK